MNRLLLALLVLCCACTAQAGDIPAPGQIVRLTLSNFTCEPNPNLPGTWSLIGTAGDGPSSFVYYLSIPDKDLPEHLRTGGRSAFGQAAIKAKATIFFNNSPQAMAANVRPIVLFDFLDWEKRSVAQADAEGFTARNPSP